MGFVGLRMVMAVWVSRVEFGIVALCYVKAVMAWFGRFWLIVFG